MADRQVIADFARSMGIATSGLRAQAGRMRVISENIANADSTAPTAGGDPYRRKVPTFTSELDRTLDARWSRSARCRPDHIGVPRQARARQSGGGRLRQRQISQRQSADRNDRHARRAAILRGEPQHHQRHAPDDPAHAQHPQVLNRKPEPWLHPLSLPMPMPSSPASWIPAGRQGVRRQRPVVRRPAQGRDRQRRGRRPQIRRADGRDGLGQGQCHGRGDGGGRNRRQGIDAGVGARQGHPGL